MAPLIRVLAVTLLCGCDSPESVRRSAAGESCSRTDDRVDSARCTNQVCTTASDGDVLDARAVDARTVDAQAVDAQAVDECGTDLDCVRGAICAGGACRSQPCISSSDCPGSERACLGDIGRCGSRECGETAEPRACP